MGTARHARDDSSLSVAGFALKLDPSMTQSAAGIPATDKEESTISVSGVRLERGDKGPKLELKLPVKTKYLMYTLKNPHRVVLELSNAKYKGALPDISAMQGISGIRQRMEEDGTYKLILESEREIRIDKSEMGDARDGYLLQVDMAYAPTEANGRAVADAGGAAASTGSSTGTFSKSPVSSDVAAREKGAGASSDVDVLIYQGRKLYQQGEIRKGLEQIIRAVELEPGHTSARTTLAMLLLQQGKEVAAREILAEGLSIKPGNSEWAKVLARILYNDGNLKEARTILEEAAPPISGNLDYHALYAGVLQGLGDHARAAIVYRNLLKYGGSNGAWWLGLAISLEAMSRETDAAVAYRNALNTPGIKPGSAEFIKGRLQSLKQRS